MIPGFLLWYLAAVLVIAAASVLSLRSYNRFAAKARGDDSFALPRGSSASPLDTLLDPVEAQHPGQQGLFNLLEGRDAFAVRMLATRQAGRSVDVITYIWSTDITGWLMIDALLAAADRGVRVRLLLDDVHVQGFDPVFLGLSQHPMIEVRLFNPIRNRGRWIRRAVEFTLGLSRFNRRIHSKVWIADGRLAIVGGRNVGDTYFGAVQNGGHAADDTDVVLVGPKVAEVETAFDSYWNLGLSLPILTLWPNFRFPLRGFRRRSARHVTASKARRFVAEAMGSHTPQSLLTDRLRWTSQVEILSDPPDKAYGRRSRPYLSSRIGDLLGQASHEVRLITPYFVPGKPGMAQLADLRRRGVAVSVLTNSLATTDLPLVHGAFTFYRRQLLTLGARIFELAPRAGGRSGRAFLHSKVFLLDGRQALIGSANFDLRSANINIEIGLLFEQADLLQELVQNFQAQAEQDLSYEVVERQGREMWLQTQDGQSVLLTAEPGAGPFRMAVTGIMRWLPHAYL